MEGSDDGRGTDEQGRGVTEMMRQLEIEEGE